MARIIAIYNNNNNNNLFINTIQVRRRRKNMRMHARNYRKRNDRNYITICTIFESVCNSQSSKAFELAAAYLQVKKGTKERNSTDRLNLFT